MCTKCQDVFLPEGAVGSTPHIGPTGPSRQMMVNVYKISKCLNKSIYFTEISDDEEGDSTTYGGPSMSTQDIPR